MNAIGSREQANGRDPAKDLKPGRMRELVAGMCSDWAVSIRTACGALRFDGSTFHYKSRRTRCPAAVCAQTAKGDQAAVEKRIREICQTRVRYGYRRVHVLLDREGRGINIKKVYRIYIGSKGPSRSGVSPQDGMQLRNKAPQAPGEGETA